MIDIIKEVISMLNVCECDKLKASGMTNECFFNSDGSLTECYKWIIIEKKKYVYVNCGSSGVFMIERETGEIYNTKGYGTIDKNKKIKADLGNITDYGDIEKVKYLHSKRYNYLR